MTTSGGLNLAQDRYTSGFVSVARQLKIYLKPLKMQTGTSVIFPTNISLIHVVFVLTSVPNVRDRFTKT